jgi:hypothetical protein
VRAAAKYAKRLVSQSPASLAAGNELQNEFVSGDFKLKVLCDRLGENVEIALQAGIAISSRSPGLFAS